MSDTKNLRDLILAASDRQKEKAEVPEWGITVFITTMSGTERDAFEAEIVTLRGKKTDLNLKNIRAKLLVRTIVDESGQRIFSDADAGELGKKSASVLSRLYEIAQKINGLREEDVEELGKGLPLDQSGDSGSD
jgi:hypothetical protein